MTRYDLAFIGLGTMGSPMAARLLGAGYSLVAYDVRSDERGVIENAGGVWADSAGAAAKAADLTLLSLPTPDVVCSVIVGPGGLIENEGAGVIVDLSTTGPRVARDLAARLAGTGKTLIDCPVSGGAEGAKAGTLALMLAGPDAETDRVARVVENLGTVYRLGAEAGQGQVMKVINNLMSTAALAITSEAMVLGCKSGLDADTMIDVINASSGRNTATTTKFPNHVLTRSFDFGMPIGLSAKDARLCLEEADHMHVPMIVGSAVGQMLKITRDHLGSDVDLTSIVRVVEEWGKHEVRGAAADSQP